MAQPCGGDPVLCIDFAVLLLGELLKDGTTLLLLTVLLGLLLRLRAERQKAAEAAYGKQLAAYDEKLTQEARGQHWVIESHPPDRPAG